MPIKNHNILFMVFLFLLLNVSSLFATEEKMVVYKSPTCGCCQKWIEHIEAAGIKVEVQEVKNVNRYKRKFGVPWDSASCHTGKIGEYFIEGHVPAADVKRLLKEKRSVAGLAVPDMPVGSPGMEMGSRKDPYDVIAISKDGSKSIYSSHNK